MKTLKVFLLCGSVTALMLGCDLFKGSEEEPFAEVNSPKEEATLFIGQSFNVRGKVKSLQEIEFFQIRLFDVKSDFEQIWRFENPSRSLSVSVNEMLSVPTTAPTGDDYRLSILGWTKNGGLGYGIKVKLAAL